MRKYILGLIITLLSIMHVNAQLYSNVINTKAALILPMLDGFGNTYIGGYYGDSTLVNGQMIYGGGFNDALLTKYDATGNLLWFKYGAGTGWDKFTRLATDGQGNVYGIINFDGTLVWEGTSYTSLGAYDFLLVKYSSNGNFEWTSHLGSSASENGFYAYLNFDANGDLHVTTNIYSSTITVNSIAQNLSSYNTNYVDFKFNASSGNLILKNVFATKNSTFATGAGVLHVDKNQNIYGSIDGALTIVGTTLPTGQYHFKINANGTLNWYKSVQVSSDRGESVVVDAQGNSIWSGDWDTQINLTDTTASQSGFASNDVYVLKRNASGVYQWSKLWGGIGSDDAPICRINANGNYVVIGKSGNMNVDGFALSAAGGDDPFWITIAPNGIVMDVQNAHSPTSDLVFNGETASVDNLGNIVISCGGNVPTNYGPFVFSNSANSFFNLFIVGNACQANGKVYRDLNNNGQLDVADQGLPNAIVATNLGGYYAMSGTSGNYNLATMTGTYSLSVPNVPLYHTLTTSATQSATFTVLGEQDSLNHFGFYPTPNVRDLTISAFNIVAPKPGQIFSAVLVYKNIGTDVANGTVGIGSPSLVNSFFANPVGTVVASDSMYWSFSNLLPGETRTIQVYFNVSSSATIGTPLLFPMTIASTGNTEMTPLNNHLDYTPLVVSSFDPNAKEVTPARVDPSYVTAGNWFYYTIHFQNTGNDTAFNIIIRDTLDGDLNMATFEQVGSSHSVNVNLRNPRVLELSYTNILLPDSFVNEPLSHGAFQFRIKANANANYLHTIPNTASIYFDYNTPIKTNSADIVIAYPESVSDVLNENIFSMYPNPANEYLHVDIPLEYQSVNTSIVLSDLTGRIVREFSMPTTMNSLSLANLSNGFYFVKLNCPTKTSIVQKLEINR